MTTRWTCFGFALFVMAMSASAATMAAPNLVILFIDDMGYGDIGPFGSTLNQTPNLDRMAEEGLKLTSFYAAPVCSASRAQLMTGCHSPRVSVPGVFFPAGPNGLNPNERTVAEYLRDLGYATMCIGKWHLGDQPQFLPTKQGFDHYFGIPYSNDMQRASLEDGRRVVPLLRDDQVAKLLDDKDQRFVTHEYTQEAVKFIKTTKRPFFLYLAHTAVHVPLFPHPDFVGHSKNGTYGDWVEEVDWSIGQVLDALRELELDKETMVLFTSDNGPWASRGKDGGVAGPLRGSKGCTLEGGVREPTIAWWPGRIKPGQSCDAIAGTADVLPTFVSLAGGEVDDDIKIDGYDISPLLLGTTDTSPRSAWYYYQGTNLKAVRSGPWKLAIAPQSLGMGIKEHPEDLKTTELRLYNLDDEIGEITNVAAAHPDVVTRLKKLTDQMIGDIGTGKPGPGVRPPGHEEHPVTLYPTQPKQSKRKVKKGKPIDWNKVKQGDAFDAGSAPAIAGHAFSIECTIAGDEPAGIIIDHGGTVVGYALYAKDGAVVFAVRHGNDQVDRVSIPIRSKQQTTVRAALDAHGTLSLSLNDGDATTVKSSGVLKTHPQEDFCVGHDNRNPLDDQEPKKPFNGTISAVRVTVQ